MRHHRTDPLAGIVNKVHGVKDGTILMHLSLLTTLYLVLLLFLADQIELAVVQLPLSFICFYDSCCDSHFALIFFSLDSKEQRSRGFTMSFIQRLGSCFVSFPSTPKMEGEEGGQCYKYVDQHGVQYCAYMEDDLSCEKSALVALDKLVEGDASDRILDAPDLSTPVVFGSGRAHKKVSFTTRDNAIRGEILLAMDREGRSYAFGVAIPATIVGSSVPTEAINNFLAPVW